MAETIVSIVVRRLDDLLIEEALLLHEVRDEIQQVITKLKWMMTFLRDADSRISVQDIRNLVVNVRELAYDAEHAVESFLLKVSSTGKTTQWMNKLKFSRNIKDIQRKMSLLTTCFRDYGIRSTTTESLEPSNSSYRTPGKLKRFYSYTTVEPEIFVGFQEDVDLLVRHLVNESDECYPLISICGMGGLGKTTLAQKIYHHPTIKTYFSCLAWVSISQKWHAKQVLQRILICLVPENKEEILTWEDDKLVENLLEIQQLKKCLIVLDDIWSIDAWDSLKLAFTDENSVSKLMLTSRIVEVAQHVNPKGFIHQPEILSAEQSWELLRLKALPKEDYMDITRDVTKMEELGREMVENCAGLPLAIVILGGILVTKPSLTEWEKVYHDSLSSLKKGKGLGEDHQRELFNVLAWSYNDLPPQLKPCFLYLGKFSEDEWIEAETLYQLWIAEGMVLSSDKRGGESMMQVAESYLGELVHKSMVRVTFNNVESSLTKFKFCFLHDLMRDLSLSHAKAEDFFEIIDLREENDVHFSPSVDFRYTRQLVIYFDKGYTSKRADSYFVKKVHKQQYRSLLLFHEFATSFPRELGLHVSKFRLLRVFSVQEVQFDKKTVSGTLSRINLGRVLGSLVYLRYLSVRDTNLLIFPYVQNLVLLQTLKFDRQDNIPFMSWLSRNILSKLGRLRHLYLPDREVHRLRKVLKLRLNGLSKLETLENFNTNWCEVEDLGKLISLQKLRLQIEDSYHDVEEMMKYLATIALSSSSCFRYLALCISSCSLWSQNGPDILRRLLWDHNFNLYELKISGKLPELAQLFEQQQKELGCTHTNVSVIRLSSLSLSLSCLEEDPMPILEKIPTLCELFLYKNAFLGMEMACTATGFQKLTHLAMWNLPNLKNWRVEKGSMPILSHLYIRRCPKLKQLPKGLIFLKFLLELLILVMPTKFCNRLRVVNGKQGADFYKVAHVSSLVLDTDDSE